MTKTRQGPFSGPLSGLIFCMIAPKGGGNHVSAVQPQPQGEKRGGLHREGHCQGNGESLNSATAIVTPAAVENYFNIYVSAIVEVPRGCCLTVAMENTSTQAISVANANMTVDRIS